MATVHEWFTTFILREMQVKTTIKPHYPPTMIAKKIDNKCYKELEKSEHSQIPGWIANWFSSFGKLL